MRISELTGDEEWFHEYWDDNRETE